MRKEQKKSLALHFILPSFCHCGGPEIGKLTNLSQLVTRNIILPTSGLASLAAGLSPSVLLAPNPETGSSREV
jgi:hypothetical protein